jgi:hypothetical protein
MEGFKMTPRQSRRICNKLNKIIAIANSIIDELSEPMIEPPLDEISTVEAKLPIKPNLSGEVVLVATVGELLDAIKEPGRKIVLTADIDLSFTIENVRDIELDCGGFDLDGRIRLNNVYRILLHNGGADRLQIHDNCSNVHIKDFTFKTSGSQTNAIDGICNICLFDNVDAHSENGWAIWNTNSVGDWTIRGGEYTVGAAQGVARFYNLTNVVWENSKFRKLAPRPGTDHWVAAVRAYSVESFLIHNCYLEAGSNNFGGRAEGPNSTNHFIKNLWLVENTILHKEPIGRPLQICNGDTVVINDNTIRGTSEQPWITTDVVGLVTNNNTYHQQSF